MIQQQTKANAKLYQICYNLSSISFRTHVIISILLRIILICYGQIHDNQSELKYTDIDYKVVTDAARNILYGDSPFDRHTYRYSPIIAFMQIPNVVVHATIGKFIYATFDIFVATIIYLIVRSELHTQYCKAIVALLNKYDKKPGQLLPINHNRSELIAKYSSIFWLYNPLTVVISTRGNGDSFSSFFVILTIYFIIKSESNLNSFLAGLTHGIAIHLRIYPLLFSLAYFLCLSNNLTRNSLGFLRQMIFPNARQLLLIFGTLITFSSITGIFYYLYGWTFIYEAYLYHFLRKDVRHNFSIYFLMQYLSDSIDVTAMEKFFIIFPQIILLIYISFSFGQFRQTLPFCIFLLTFIMVTYNSVVTSQYFVWYLALLSLCFNNLQAIHLKKAIIYFSIWLIGQGMWLLPAYLLEFQTINTFNWIGFQSACYFLINIFLLNQFIQNYSFVSFKINYTKLF